jgi:peptide/nickel transport system ATP-binding protein
MDSKTEAIIHVDDLIVNFYTYQGVVKALDGVTLTINRKETFGLVGETGCGKSVTANALLRLIPSPPGKIESGHVFFSPTAEVWNEVEEKRKRLKELKIQGKDTEALALKKEIYELLKPNDLLIKSKDYMQKIRGKYISMIFQEPMSALNPVFTIGDQISEIILLHEMEALCNSALRKKNEELDSLNNFKKAKKIPTEKNEFKCSNCGSRIQKNTSVCPQCHSNFKMKATSTFRKIKFSIQIKYLQTVLNDQNSYVVRIINRIPIVRRLEKPLKEEAYEMAERMLRLVRIPDPQTIINDYPFELSGGMQQRVMIAMALACKPQLLIADEPTTALDVTIQAQILRLMKELQQEMGTSILLITHNLGVVAEVCDRMGVMYAGNMVEVGQKMEIFEEPLHPYTQGLINSIPKINQTVDRLQTIEGTVPNLIKPPSGCRFNPRCPFAMEICKEEKPELIEIRPDHQVACHLYKEVI